MRESILVVDDEPFVLSAVCGILRRAGYEVLSAADPAQALVIGESRAVPIHLLLSDVVMPKMSGPTLAEHFAELHPETLPMFMAGMPDHPEVIERIVACGRAFLPKPFHPATLLNRVREVLAAAGGELVA